MTYVAKISMPGYDVESATPEQCAVHSEYPPLKSKVDQSPPHFALLTVNFTAKVTQNVTHTVYSIPHGYDYIPATLSNIIFNDNNGSGDIVGIGYAGVGANLIISAHCTATHFIVKIYDNFNWTRPGATLKVSYYIFAENGT